MADRLELTTLHRIGSANPQKRERYTFDFVVNGLSLFEATAAKFDMCGCLADPQFDRETAHSFNGTMASSLISGAPVGRSQGVPLFVCSECGDLGCGAITVRISRDARVVQWHDFAYENGFEAVRRLNDVGPFEFERGAYVTQISRLVLDLDFDLTKEH
jgi:hypothetical protein